MCGIAGIIDYREKPAMSIMEKVSNLMAHRGPDEEGFFNEGPVGLLHRRLSIIDLSGGSQPMFNEDKNLVIVFNGEIYNFIELRHLLESKGHIFTTKSDTEVILHGYEEWGENCVEKLSGMFAFAIYNRKDESFFLARDRCGEKPLYYYHMNGKFGFASEIQALLAIIGQTPSADEKSICLYLRLGYIPAPYSFFKDIKKLSAGYYITLKSDELKAQNYYKAGLIKADKTISEQELCDELDAILNRVVQRMLVSDVSLGAFLSGGLDSSLIVAIMAKSGMKPQTFSIAFNHSSFDESAHALKVSELIGTDHTVHTVEFDDFEKSLSIMDCFGEPFADYSGIPSWYLSQKTRSKVKVALSGDGADELFGGYRRYVSQSMARYFGYVPPWVRKNIIGKLISLFPDSDGYYADSNIKSARIFLHRYEAVKGGLMSNTIFSDEEIRLLYPNTTAYREDIFNTTGGNSTEALMLSDRIHYLPDNIMFKVDRTSMRHSLETRSPFLDPEVLNFSERIPLSMKIKGVTQKYILKKLALRYLPKDIVFRKKHGFVVPMAQWLNKDGIDNVRNRIGPWCNSNYLENLLLTHFEKRVDCSHKLFALIMLGRYLNQ